MAEFTHLHVHTEYSLLDGAARIHSLVKKAKQKGMKSLAITDHGSMYGAIPFYKACQKEGIKPIIGCEVYITPGNRKERVSSKEKNLFHLVLLAKNITGYKNMMKLVSVANLEGFYYKPRVDKEVLGQYSEGIIALSACLAGEVNYMLSNNQYDKAKKSALEYLDIFGEGNFYLEIQDHGLEEQKKINPLIISLSQETGIPLTATNDVHYIEKQDAVMQDVLLAIGTGTSINDDKRLRFPTDEFYLKDSKEMMTKFAHIPQAIENTNKIAEQCNLAIPLDQHALPKFPLANNVTSIEYLRALTIKGIGKRYKQIDDRIKERLEYELSIIERMGFADYFLIVWDFMKYAHQTSIVTGPGRGSAAGSLVAYTLGITDVDPIKYGLLFERFLNPERINMPDIDIDFNYERRDEVIAYVSKKYGPDRVAQIITFGTFAAKAAIRDVGRVLDIPYGQVDKIAKLIPSQIGITIEQALKDVKELRDFYEKDKKLRQLIDIAKKIEGMPRHHSTHAAGVIISDKPLTDYTPLQVGQENISLSQYPMGVLEEIGLLKMDFLGLRNLTIIEKTLAWIYKTKKTKIDFHDIEDDDPLTYELLGRGQAKGVFQLESAGITKVLKELKPTRFEDIVAVLALYRPGPMEFIPEYIQAKHGKRKVTYPHETLKSILEDTYGIIVYQEQIMQIASTMAGFSLGEADLLRRAVGKKKREILMQEKDHFVNGAVKKGYDKQVAENVYHMIVKFANYGFNRSHAVAYGVIAFQTAYLKAHYPVEFMAALISESLGAPEKVVEYIDEGRRLGIEVLPPNVLKSGPGFTIEAGKIRFGLVAIKNVGTQVIHSIINDRMDRESYKSIIDFCIKVDAKVCNKKTMEALILSGALDTFGIHRGKLMANLDDILDRVQKRRKLQDDLQIHMFDEFDQGVNDDFDWIEVDPYTSQELLFHEKEMLGIYLSGHPLGAYKNILNKQVSHRFEEIFELKEGTRVVVGGLVTDIKIILTKKGEQMAFVQLEIYSKQIELVVFPKQFQRSLNHLVKDHGVLVKGKVNHHDDQIKIIVDDIKLLSSIKNQDKDIKEKQVVYIKITENKDNPEALNTLKNTLLKHKGSSPVVLYYQSNKKTLRLSEKYLVNPNEALIKSVEKIFGESALIIK